MKRGIQIVDVSHDLGLDEYEAHASLARAVQELRAEAATLVPALAGRRVWMVNSTPQGGGVAEMLPRLVSLLRELGVPAEWAVIGTGEQRFFDLTKRLHNLIHGTGTPGFSTADRELYERVNRDNADDLARRLAPGDLLVIHDPQPMALGALLAERLRLPALWRCHIGLDRENAATASAWDFLAPYAGGYDHAVFSAPEYVRAFPPHRAAVIHPALDPLSDKNRLLSPVRLTGVLANACLVRHHEQVLTPPFADTVERLAPDGRFVPAEQAEPIGILYRPLVTQISRWDRLKGWLPLLAGFAHLKRGETALARAGGGPDPLHDRRRRIVRLVLAGPDPASIQDDPEGREVLDALRAAYQELPADLQRDVAILSLPMSSRRQNALIVNALQRASTVVVQNSIEEGFGLTVAEAMWKRAAVVGSRACGIRQQIRDGVDGRLIADPSDPATVADCLDEVLAHPRERATWGRNAERRAHDAFLVFTQIAQWLRLLVRVVEARPEA
ncbi:MAG TPA: glycosyltransferase [Thermoanaerobaculia bacterium]|nr:glycosyltransferase [Thermoanaerobaculia bacterium]